MPSVSLWLLHYLPSQGLHFDLAFDGEVQTGPSPGSVQARMMTAPAHGRGSRRTPTPAQERQAEGCPSAATLSVPTLQS